MSNTWTPDQVEAQVRTREALRTFLDEQHYYIGRLKADWAGTGRDYAAEAALSLVNCLPSLAAASNLWLDSDKQSLNGVIHTIMFGCIGHRTKPRDLDKDGLEDWYFNTAPLDPITWTLHS